MLDPLLWSPPLVIAHRGSRELWPENTMFAFEKALSYGVEHLETDVHVSADGVVHCFHDDTLTRITGQEGLFIDRTAREIAKLDAGYSHRGPGGFDFRASQIGVPTFEELVTTFPEVRVVVDLKHDEVVEPLARTVKSLGVGERLIVGSFDDDRIDRFRELVGESIATSTGVAAVRFWLLASRSGRGFSGSASALQVPLQMRGLRIVDQKLVDAAHERGVQVHAWTVNDPAMIRHLVSLGVDGIVTDRPDLAMAEVNG
ncbi:MAG TPA: glycerophosphodiester phosphodiesterase [Acidimicrobiia bacterium]